MPMSLSILVLDDCTDTVELLSEFLRHRGCHVIASVDGIEGLQLARIHRPDIVLTDILLPGMSGFQIVDRLKSDPAYHPWVIVMSALDSLLYKAYATALGADDFLHKPFCLRQLLDSVRHICPAATEAEMAIDDETAEVEADALVLS
jgi:DNA-binding response OmpR family regulator